VAGTLTHVAPECSSSHSSPAIDPPNSSLRPSRNPCTHMSMSDVHARSPTALGRGQAVLAIGTSSPSAIRPGSVADMRSAYSEDTASRSGSMASSTECWRSSPAAVASSRAGVQQWKRVRIVSKQKVANARSQINSRKLGLKKPSYHLPSSNVRSSCVTQQ
jgi:hypothetical protein